MPGAGDAGKISHVSTLWPSSDIACFASRPSLDLSESDTEAWRLWALEMGLIRAIKDEAKRQAWEAIKGGVKDFRSLAVQLIEGAIEDVLRAGKKGEKEGREEG